MKTYHITLSGLLSVALASCGGGDSSSSTNEDPDVVNPGIGIATPTATAGVYQCDYGTDSSYVYVPGNGHLAANGQAVIRFSSPGDTQATINDTITWACQEHTGDIYGKYNTDHRGDQLKQFSYRITANKAYLDFDFNSSGWFVTSIGASATAPPQTTPATFNFIYSYTFTFTRMVTQDDGSAVYEGTYTCQVSVNQTTTGTPMSSEGTFRFFPDAN